MFEMARGRVAVSDAARLLKRGKGRELTGGWKWKLGKVEARMDGCWLC